MVMSPKLTKIGFKVPTFNFYVNVYTCIWLNIRSLNVGHFGRF